MRRNIVIADRLRADDPGASITIVTGLPNGGPWLRGRGVDVFHVPPLLKRSDGSYRPIGMSFEDAVAARRDLSTGVIVEVDPDVVIVDRHPYGTAGELREGVALARRRGSALVLGLRDVLDTPEVVRRELAGLGWEGVENVYTEALVYGASGFCDHQAEYGLPLAPRYCGWVAETPVPGPREARLLVVAAGGGGDGADVFRLGTDVAERRPKWRAEIVSGPFGNASALATIVSRSAARNRISLAPEVAGCGATFARAAAVLEMAGYNSTFEALAAGHRPILVPRRAPRREQAIRASRLAALGLADVVDEHADADEVDWLLDRPRRIFPDQLKASGIHLDGAGRAAAWLMDLASARSAA